MKREMRVFILCSILLIALYGSVIRPTEESKSTTKQIKTGSFDFIARHIKLPTNLRFIVVSLFGIRHIELTMDYSYLDDNNWQAEGNLIIGIEGDERPIYVPTRLGTTEGEPYCEFDEATRKIASRGSISIPIPRFSRWGVIKSPFGDLIYRAGVFGLVSGDVGPNYIDIGIGLELKGEIYTKLMDLFKGGFYVGGSIELHLKLIWENNKLRLVWYILSKAGIRIDLPFFDFWDINWGTSHKSEEYEIGELDFNSGESQQSPDLSPSDVPLPILPPEDWREGGGSNGVDVDDFPNSPGSARDIGDMFDHNENESDDRPYISYPVWGKCDGEDDWDYFYVGMPFIPDDGVTFYIWWFNLGELLYNVSSNISTKAHRPLHTKSILPEGNPNFDIFLIYPACGNKRYSGTTLKIDPVKALYISKETISQFLKDGKLLIAVHTKDTLGYYIVTASFGQPGLQYIMETIPAPESVGPHYNDPNSPAWQEYEVCLDANKKYKITLNWDSDSDLDLYVYRPLTAPSQGGIGSNFYAASATLNKPEVVIFTPNETGMWIICVDHYSGTQETKYTIQIEQITYTGDDFIYTAPCTIEGIISGVNSYGPHYNVPQTRAWNEHMITLHHGVKYKLTLNWDSDVDLDLYLYYPGTSPYIDNEGDDYIACSCGVTKPEIILFEANLTGTWVIGVDQYSRIGNATYTITVEIIEGGSGGGSESEVYEPPCSIVGAVSGVGSDFAHCDQPDSPAWFECRVNLVAGVTYVFTLNWCSRTANTSDLDMYLYLPGTAPTEDGDGSDFELIACDSTQSESFTYTPSVSGIYTVAVDHFSAFGYAHFRLVVKNITESSNETVFYPDCIIHGGLVGTERDASHYTNPSSVAWAEYRVYLEENVRYNVLLRWDGVTDLDLFVYLPNTSPSIDGDGCDYYAASHGINRPEMLTFVPNVTGIWVIAIDHYSGNNFTNYVLEITSGGSVGPDGNVTYVPPCTIMGSVFGFDDMESHYNDPSSSAWTEFRILLEENVTYRFSLTWDVKNDLDLYLYGPGMAPSEDGNGSDFIDASFSVDVPEVIVYTPSETGIYTVAVDQYGGYGTTEFYISVEILSGKVFQKPEGIGHTGDEGTSSLISSESGVVDSSSVVGGYVSSASQRFALYVIMLFVVAVAVVLVVKYKKHISFFRQSKIEGEVVYG